MLGGFFDVMRPLSRPLAVFFPVPLEATSTVPPAGTPRDLEVVVLIGRKCEQAIEGLRFGVFVDQVCVKWCVSSASPYASDLQPFSFSPSQCCTIRGPGEVWLGALTVMGPLVLVE